MTKLSLNDKVRITELNTKGRIIGIYLSDLGYQYQVRYFYDGDAKTVYFFEDEIEAVH